MVDSQKTNGQELSDSDRNNLLQRIDELESILAKKKQKLNNAQRKPDYN